MQVAHMLSTEGSEWAVQAAFAQAVLVQRNNLPSEHLKAARCCTLMYNSASSSPEAPLSTAAASRKQTQKSSSSPVTPEATASSCMQKASPGILFFT